MQTKSDPYRLGVHYPRGSQGTKIEGPFREREEADRSRKETDSDGDINDNKLVCFEAGTIFNEPRIPPTLSPSQASQGNRTHAYAINTLEVHNFLTEYWTSQDECFEDNDPNAGDNDREAINDAYSSDPQSDDDSHDNSQTSDVQRVGFHNGD